MKRLLILVIVVIAGSAFTLYLLHRRGEERPVKRWMKQLESSDWEERAEAFYHLNELPEELKRDKVKLAFIELLERENALLKEKAKLPPRPWPEGEGEGEYHLFVAEAVVNLKDKRAIPALIGVIECGNAVTSALAEMGEPAVDPLIRKLTSGDRDRSAAARALGKMLKSKERSSVIHNPVTKSKIKKALIATLKDKDPYTREYAIIALGHLGDVDLIPLINSLAAEDPYFITSTLEESNGKTIYPVREAATKTLALLEQGS